MNRIKTYSPASWGLGLKSLLDFLPHAGVVVAYFIAAKLCLNFATLHENVTPVWVPSGLALAAQLALGFRCWPAIWAGAFLTNYFTNVTWVAAAGIATGNTLEAVVGAWFICRWIRDKSLLATPGTILLFVVSAAIIAPMVGATLGVVSLALDDTVTPENFPALWSTWWLGDATGALLVTPFVLAWQGSTKADRRPKDFLEVSALGLALLVVSGIAFQGWFHAESTHYPLAYLPFPALLWSAFRLQRRGITMTLLVLTGMALWGTSHGDGPFAQANGNDAWLLLDGFVSLSGMTLFIVSSMVAQNADAQQALRQASLELEHRVKERTHQLQQSSEQLRISKDRLNSILMSMTDVVWSASVDGKKIHYLNPAAERIFGYPLEKLFERPSMGLELIHPDDRSRVDAAFQALMEHHTPFDVEYRIVRPDQTICWVRDRGQMIYGPTGQAVRMDGLATDISDYKQVEAELLNHAQRLRDVPCRLVEVQEAERRWIAEELHDMAAQNLTAIGINFDVIEHELPREIAVRLDSRLADTRALIEDTAASIRCVITDLRPSTLDYLGFIPAVQSYTRQFECRTGIAVEVRGADLNIRLPVEVESALFRIVQEALSNCAKHARANAITIELKPGPTGTTISIKDNGVGFDPASLGHREQVPGLGLVMMRERANAIGAKLHVESAPGKGTQITIATVAAQTLPSQSP